MKEDSILEQKFGRERPFKVPEGYFSQFEKQLLDNLPEQKSARKVSISRYWKRIVSVAACVAVVIVSGVLYFNNAQEKMQSPVSAISDMYKSSSVYADYVIDEFSDYAMLDNEDFYSYVVGE